MLKFLSLTCWYTKWLYFMQSNKIFSMFEKSHFSWWVHKETFKLIKHCHHIMISLIWLMEIESDKVIYQCSNVFLINFYCLYCLCIVSEFYLYLFEGWLIDLYSDKVGTCFTYFSLPLIVIKVGPLAAHYQVPLRHILLVWFISFMQSKQVNICLHRVANQSQWCHCFWVLPM